MKLKKLFLPLAAAAVLICLSSCGKELTLQNEAFEEQIQTPAGVFFNIKNANKNAVTYTISSEEPLYYEGHMLAFLQQQSGGSWYTVKMKNFASTADFRVEEIGSEPTEITLNMASYYEGTLKKGTNYRLLAECYPTIDDLEKVDPDKRVYLAAEFCL